MTALPVESALPIERPPARRPRHRPARAAGQALPAEVPGAARVPGATGDGPGASFADLGVPAPLVTALTDAGITTPFPIQAATLPDALSGLDILGRGRTGSGKTLAFSIPLVAGLAGGHTSAGRPRGLILVPTRELANQVKSVLAPLARAAGLSVTAIFGGTGQHPQVAALRRRTDIVVACPGRLADLIRQGHCHLGDVEISVLDEADHMADLGFLPVVRRLMEATPPQGQRMLFSATLDAAVDVLVRRFLSDPAVHSVDSPAAAPAAMVHHVLTVAPQDRVGVVAELASGQDRSLVFTRTKHGAQRLAGQLAEAGVPVAQLHGNLGQGARERNLAAFASGTARVLVATDIAARGIHVDGIHLVVHADPPAEHKAYLHRSGRTARAGAAGVVVTLQVPAQATDVRALMRRAGVVPLAATVSPDSALLRSIAGPPAARSLPAAQPAGAPPAAAGAPPAPDGRGTGARGPGARARRTGRAGSHNAGARATGSPRAGTRTTQARTTQARTTQAPRADGGTAPKAPPAAGRGTAARSSGYRGRRGR